MTKKLMMMVAAFAVAVGAWAETWTDPDSGYTWTYRINDDTAEIYNYGSVAISPLPTGAVAIPPTLGGKSVTSIGSFAFSDCTGLTSVVIPEGVTNIGYMAFYNCVSLSHVMLPDSLVALDAVGSFDGAPYVWSTLFPDFILSASGKTLYGIKAYDKPYEEVSEEFNRRQEKGTIFIPATVQSIKDYALGHIYGRPVDGNGWSGWGGAWFRFIFTGNKPEMTSKAWLWAWYEWESAPAAVYFTNGSSGWTWGEEWCGVKTYTLNEVPEEYAVQSDLKIGDVYGGGWWADGPLSSQMAYEIWDNGTIGTWGDEMAFVSVTGSGTINPVILYGDTPVEYLGPASVWTDKQLFEKFVPSGVESSKWEDEYHTWYYETSKACYEWAKSIWPENKVVSNRRWIVVPAKEVDGWSGVMNFRVGISGTSEISSAIIVHHDDRPPSNLRIDDFFHGMTVTGVENFEPWDHIECCAIRNPSGTIAYWIDAYAQTHEFVNWAAYEKNGKAFTFAVSLPCSGTLVIAERNNDDVDLADKTVFGVSGGNISKDVVTTLSDNWEDPDYCWTVTNFWKTTYARRIRRIEVSGKTTLTFTRNDLDGADCEFSRMYFFPKSGKSVAIEAGYGTEELADDQTPWGYSSVIFVQGYVTGGGVYKSGETATLKAVSGDGEEFDHWEVRFGNLTLTEAQKTSPTLSFMVTDAMCGTMEDEEQIFISAIWKPKYKVTVLPSIVGAGTVTGTGRYFEGETVTLSATAAEGCAFVKWSDGETAATRQIKVEADDVERVIYACFEAPNGVPMANESGVSATELYEAVDGAVPTAAASVYDGYLVDAKGNVAGSIQVKVGKPKAGLASVKATVVVGVTKSSLKGADNGKAAIAANGPTTMRLVGGESCEVTLGAEGLSGSYGSYQIDGARNFFTSKDKGEQGAANAILEKWIGAVNVAWREEGAARSAIAPYQTLSVTIGKKGKAKVAVTLADGTKATANAQLLVGEEWLCVPVVVTKKMNLAFTLWLPRNDGAALVEGLSGDVVVGKPGALAANAAFRVGKSAALWSQIAGRALTDYLPDGMAVTQSGAKWTLPKAGKVQKAKDGTIDSSKLGENPSALKLTYKANDGSFKGSFKVYADNGGKLKATTVNVAGIVVGGVGYGTATIKKVGSVPVKVE